MKRKTRSGESLHLVLTLAGKGYSNFYLGSKFEAENCFAQALSSMDSELCELIDPSLGDDLNICRLPKKQRNNGDSSQVNATNIDTSEKPKEKKFDEGMDVFTEPLELNEPMPSNFIASALLYNIGIVHAESNRDAVAYECFLRSRLMSQTLRDPRSILEVKILHNLGRCSYNLRELKRSLSFYQEASEIVQELGLSGNILAASLNCVAVVGFHHDEVANESLQELLRQSIMIYQARPTENEIALATVMNNLGRILHLRRNFEEALSFYNQALAIRKLKLGEDSMGVAAISYNLGRTLHKLRRNDEAIEAYQLFLSIVEQSSNTWYKAMGLTAIGDVHRDERSSNQALSSYLQALKAQQASVRQITPEVCATLDKNAHLCHEMGNLEVALKYYKHILNIERELYPPNHSNIKTTLQNIAYIEKALGHYDLALDAYNHLYDMSCLESDHSNSVKVAGILSNMGSIYFRTADYESAFDCFQEALGILRDVYGDDNHPEIASTVNFIGLVFFKQGMYGLARISIAKGLKIRRALFGSNHRDVATSWYNLATILFETGEPDRALVLYNEALRAERESLGFEHPDVVTTMQQLGKLYYQLGKLEEAQQMFQEALEIELGREAPCADQLIKLLNFLGNHHLQLGNTSEMMTYYSKVARLFQFDTSAVRNTLAISGYIWYGLNKLHPPCAPAA